MTDNDAPEKNDETPQPDYAGGGENSNGGGRERPSFPIVGIGASAGGLEALQRFFSAAPENTGMAFAVVVHLSPKHTSHMPDLLQKTTAMMVKNIEDGETIEPDRVYITPPNRLIGLEGGVFKLLEKTDQDGRQPVDFFFRQLAENHGALAACVILSGSGSDGSTGLREIKTNDGVVLVQSEESADYTGMPHSAIATGLADMVLTPAEMPDMLTRFFKNRDWILRESSQAGARFDWLQKIIVLLKNRTGHDFSMYKKNTIVRRISRRMGIRQISDHMEYVQILRENVGEIDALFREILIGVTNFFRDPEAYDALREYILKAMKDLGDDPTFRAWVPGCSTGEEAYSIAILLKECAEELDISPAIQIFGTDIDPRAVEQAREGLYPESVAGDIRTDRLRKSFSKEGAYYRIRKEIRDMVIFSAQDVLKDPPFSKLDLLCCRNLLIYLDNNAQKKLMPLFHYTLKSGGLLLLGTSESVGGFANLFEPLDNKWKIFGKREVPLPARPFVEFPTGTAAEAHPVHIPFGFQEPGELDLARQTQKLILQDFAPTCVLVDVKGNIHYVQGRTGKYLETVSGQPTNNIVDMAREGLRIELASALRRAAASENTVERKNVRVKSNGDVQPIDLIVSPIKTSKLAGQLLVVFRDLDLLPAGSEAHVRLGGDRDEQVTELERELQETRESHQTTIEELETSNEELKSMNEELQSSNEELQSTNEELESSKEELQSLNEELQTVNSELQNKIDELASSHDDTRNLLNSTQVGTIFLDNDLKVKRYTPQAAKIVNLIPTDLGRPLVHISNKLQYERLVEDAELVRDNLTPLEREVGVTDGDWYVMRILPYRTMDNRIDGVVITFLKINEQKKAFDTLIVLNDELERARALNRAIFDTVTGPMVVLDKNLSIVTANEPFFAVFERKIENTEHMQLFDLSEDWEDPELKELLDKALDTGVNFRSFKIERVFPKIGNKKMVLSGKRVVGTDNSESQVLLFLENVSGE